MINAATVTLISAQWHICYGLQQIKLDEKVKAHEKSDKMLSGTGSKTDW